MVRTFMNLIPTVATLNKQLQHILPPKHSSHQCVFYDLNRDFSDFK